MKTLHISAGGRGTRIAKTTEIIKDGLPKHLLPLPSKRTTVLGKIVKDATASFDNVKLWCNEENWKQIATSILPQDGVSLTIDLDMTGPLGPLIREALHTEQTSYGCAGDFYCDFDWDDFMDFHASHSCPISILVSRSIAVPSGARFLVSSDNTVDSWERVHHTESTDLINIGAYIVDPVPAVARQIKLMDKHKEDPFFDMFIPQELVAGYNPGIIGYNINVSRVYESLLQAITTD